LNCNIKTSTVERFKHDFGSVFPVFWGVKRLAADQPCSPTTTVNFHATYRFSKEEMMILGLDPKILENRVGPKSFHMILDT
jgi:hypothetical protein